MQRQQELTPLIKSHRRKRSVLEVVLSLLLIVGGGVAALACVTDYLRSTHPDPLLDKAIYGVFLAQGVFGFLGGVLSLLGARTLTRWSLHVAAFFSLITAGAIVVGTVTRFITGGTLLETILFTASFVFLSVALFHLGRWLGRQED